MTFVVVGSGLPAMSYARYLTVVVVDTVIGAEYERPLAPLGVEPSSVYRITDNPDPPASVAFNTAPLNLSGHPALSIPTEWGRGGALPTAVQLIAPRLGEHAAFRAAFVLEETIGPFQ